MYVYLYMYGTSFICTVMYTVYLDQQVRRLPELSCTSFSYTIEYVVYLHYQVRGVSTTDGSICAR